MFSESRNDRRRRIGDSAAADRLRDRDNAAGFGDNSTEIDDGAAGAPFRKIFILHPRKKK